MRELAEFTIQHATKLGATYAEARLQTDIEHVYLLKQGNPEMAGLARAKGLGIRVLANGGLGFTAINRPDKALVKKRVKEAVGMAKASTKVKAKPIQFSAESVVEKKWEVKPRIPFEDISVEEKIQLLIDIDKAVSTLKEVKVSVPYRMLELVESYTEKHFINSEGTTISSKIPRILFFGFLTAHEKAKGTEQDVIQKGESRGWEAVREWKLIDHARQRAETLGKILKTATKPPKGKIDLILGNQVVGLMVHESTGHPYEADRILGREAAQAGESFITKDMIGKRIGSKTVTIVDDPTLKNSYGHYLYDEEGIPAKRRFLMKQGIITEFLHNRETAEKMQITSNAAARASRFDREPIIRMANTFMLPGNHTFNELLEDIHLGLFMKTFGEWNIDDRRYSMRFTGRECYLIKSGKLKEMVRHPTLEITTPGFYGSIDALDKSLEFEAATCGKGDPAQGMPVWHGGPNARLRGVRLGGIE